MRRKAETGLEARLHPWKPATLASRGGLEPQRGPSDTLTSHAQPPTCETPDLGCSSSSLDRAQAQDLTGGHCMFKTPPFPKSTHCREGDPAHT